MCGYVCADALTIRGNTFVNITAYEQGILRRVPPHKILYATEGERPLHPESRMFLAQKQVKNQAP